jgi:hypothetical protein
LIFFSFPPQPLTPFFQKIIIRIRKYGDFIACAWIRKVDGANNTDARFAAAFAGVDPSKFKLYTDDEIPGLADVDVAGGKCS